MTRKVKLFISMSLDGYIAEKDQGISWLEVENNEPDNTYDQFYRNVDTVLMGYNTYHQIVKELAPNDYPYEDSLSIIFTRKKIANFDRRVFTDRSINETVDDLKTQEGKDIWVVGGSQIIQPLVAKDMIDEYYIAVIPILIGDGIPLFAKNNCKIKLKLQETYDKNGIVYLRYKK